MRESDFGAHGGSAGAVDGKARFYGFECVNRGDGKDPWPAAQLDAMRDTPDWMAWITRVVAKARLIFITTAVVGSPVSGKATTSRSWVA